MDRCEIPRCRAEVDVTYLGHGICDEHWDELTAADAPPDRLREVLGIGATPGAAMEEAMDDGSKKKSEATQKTEVAGKGKKAAKPKQAATAKAETPAPESKPVKEPKPAKEKQLRQKEQLDGEVVVFAFRLGSNDRDRIHAAAGPAGATKFVRSAALAAATGDAKAFETLVAQARQNAK